MDDRIGVQLLESSLITREQLDNARQLRERDGSSLGAALVRLGALSETDYLQFLSRTHRVPAVELAGIEMTFQWADWVRSSIHGVPVSSMPGFPCAST